MMDEKPKQTAKDTETFEGVKPSGVVLLKSTIWFFWGHLIGMAVTAASSLFVKSDTKIGKFPLGQWIEKHQFEHWPNGKPLPQFLKKSPLLLGALAVGWVFGGIVGTVVGGIAGIPDSDRGIKQFNRMQGKLNDALEENAVLKEKLGESKTPVASSEPKPKVQAGTLVRSENNLMPVEGKVQAM